MADQTMCKVRDLRAITEPRTHELPDEDGRLVSYTFKPREHVPMPMTHAMLLVSNDGFEVLDSSGKRLQVRTPTTAGGAKSNGIVLRPDEVVAKLDELTLDALLQRAVRIPGGEELKKNDGKEKIIGFMLSAHDHAADGKLGTLVNPD